MGRPKKVAEGGITPEQAKKASEFMAATGKSARQSVEKIINGVLDGTIKEPLLGAQEAVKSAVEAAVPESKESVSGAGSGVAIMPPKPPVTYRFICGCCHTAHVGIGKELDNRMGTFRVLDRRIEISGDLTLMEVLCLKCGMTTWKVIPGNEGKVAFKNLDLRRG